MEAKSFANRGYIQKSFGQPFQLIMSSLSKVIFILFLITHLFIININAAEWGDSYRILRASEYVRNFTYPQDEKRPPLYSTLLAIRPSFIDQIVWGRLFMLLVSVGAFFIFYKLCKQFLANEKAVNLALLLFSFNPVFLYWSLRIYADVFFVLIVMLCIHLYFKWYETLDVKKIAVLGLLSGLSVLTRFEGYILFGSLGIGILLGKNFTKKIDLLQLLKSKFKLLFAFAITFSLLVVPYLLGNNPLTSKYLDEPTGRSYDFRMLLIFAVSLIYLFGFTNAFAFTGKLKYYFKNPFVFSYIIFELLLILLWPAAIPRLFLPLIPILTIVFADSLVSYFESKESRIKALLLSVFLLIVFVVSQYFLKLQFLVPYKSVFILIVVLQVILIVLVFIKAYKAFVTALVLSLIIWSLSSVWVHKDIYISVKEAAVYAQQNLEGSVGFNDVSSVTDWYLNYKNPQTRIKGVYYNYSKKADLNEDALLKKGFDYIILTNEHNTDTTLDIESRPYLEQITEFQHNINGKIFWTKIIKIRKLG